METPSAPKTKCVAKRQSRTSPGEVSTPPTTSSMSGSQKTTSAATPKVTTVSSGNAPTPTSSSSSTRGTAAKKRKADEAKTPEVSPAAKGKQDDLAPFKTMPPADLKTLLTSVPPNNYLVTNRQYILVDTRDATNFIKCRVKSNHVARFPVTPDAAVQSQEFISKGAVVNYFLENKADLLDVLQAPGFYNCVVVLNEYSSASGSKLRSFMNALAKWNENTPTSIYLLGGGVQAFSNLYPEQSAFGKVAPPVEPASGSSTTSTPNNPSPEDCLKHLDAIVTSKVLVNLASKLKSLSSVLSVLREAELEIRKGNVVLKAAMCPVCKKIFSGEIMLCEKGHSVCVECHSRWKELALCGQDQCGAPISGKTRNWSLERLLAVATCHCPCGQHVTMAESEAHLEECVRKGKDFERIQQLIIAVHPQIREENEKLANLRKTMVDYDLNYIPKVFEEKIPEQMGAVAWDAYVSLRAAKEKAVAALSEELLSLAAIN